MHANDNVRVPDIAVTCTPPGKAKTIRDPVLIVDILSPGNTKDTWNSIYALSTIPTLAEIVVVESTSVRVEVYRRGKDGSWPLGGEVSEQGGKVGLTSIDAEFPISDIYSGTYLA